MGYMVQKYVVEDAKKASPLMPQHIALVDPKGRPVQLGGSAPAADSITTAMLKDGQVTESKLAQNAVGEGNIKKDAVTAAKVKGGTLTADKLAAGVLPANATKAKAGLVKQAAKVDDCADGTGEHLMATVNALLRSLRDSGALATS